jgi:hypothetical protein
MSAKFLSILSYNSRTEFSVGPRLLNIIANPSVISPLDSKLHYRMTRKSGITGNNSWTVTEWLLNSSTLDWKAGPAEQQLLRLHLDFYLWGQGVRVFYASKERWASSRTSCHCMQRDHTIRNFTPASWTGKNVRSFASAWMVAVYSIVCNIRIKTTILSMICTIVGPANQGGCIIRCVGNLADEKL